MLALTFVSLVVLAANPTPQRLVEAMRDADGGRVTVSNAVPPLPEGARMEVKASKSGALELTRMLGKKRLGQLEMTPDPKKAGLGDGEFFMQVTRSLEGEPTTTWSCSARVGNNARYQATLWATCYPPDEFRSGARAATTFTLTVEPITLVIEQSAGFAKGGALTVRIERPAAIIAEREAWWKRFTRRVTEKATLPLSAQSAPRDTDQWALIPDVSARVSVEDGALHVAYVGAKATATYVLEPLLDWGSQADARVMALRMSVPGDKPRVCPFTRIEATKKPFDTSGEAFAILGACYAGLTKAMLVDAQGSLGGLAADPAGATKDGSLQIQVNDARLLVVTAPGPKAYPNAWLRVDSAR